MTHHYMEHEKETPESRALDLVAAMSKRLMDGKFLGYQPADLRFEVRMEHYDALKAVASEIVNGLEVWGVDLYYQGIRVVGRLLLKNSPDLVVKRGARPAEARSAGCYDPTPGATAGGLLDPGPGTGQPPCDMPQDGGTGQDPRGPWIFPGAVPGPDVLREATQRRWSALPCAPTVTRVPTVFEGEELVVPYARVHHLTKSRDVVINEKDEREEELVVHVHFEPEREDSTEIPTVVTGAEAQRFLDQWKAYLNAYPRG